MRPFVSPHEKKPAGRQYSAASHAVAMHLPLSKQNMLLARDSGCMRTGTVSLLHLYNSTGLFVRRSPLASRGWESGAAADDEFGGCTGPLQRSQYSF